MKIDSINPLKLRSETEQQTNMETNFQEIQRIYQQAVKDNDPSRNHIDIDLAWDTYIFPQIKQRAVSRKRTWSIKEFSRDALMMIEAHAKSKGFETRRECDFNKNPGHQAELTILW